MLINKLIHRLALPYGGYNLVNPLAFFAGEKKAEKPKEAPKEGGGKAPAKGGKQAQKKAGQTPAQKAKKQQQEVQRKKQQEQALKHSAFAVKSQAGNLYRKIIRNINIKKKTQRASFHEQTLLHLINIATRRDLNLIYEAYYNYLGHFTPISNKTVDALLERTILLGNQKQEALEEATKKLFQILDNHQYLGYFPHYDIMLRAARLADKGSQFPHFVETLKNKPLIKINGKAVKVLYEIATDWKDFAKLTKIFAYRANKQILADMTNQQLLKEITEGIKKFQKIQITKMSGQLKEFIEKTNPSSLDAAIVWLITGDTIQVPKILEGVQKDDPKLKEFKDIVGKIEEGKDLDRLKDLLSKNLQATAHKDLLQ